MEEPTTPDFSSRSDSDSMLLASKDTASHSLTSLGSPFSESDVELPTKPKDLEVPSQLSLEGITFSDSELLRDRETIGSVLYSSALESESQFQQRQPSGLRRKKTDGSLTPSPLLSPKPRKKVRRKSRNSEVPSERSHRSEHLGIGYTLTPATGKIFRNLLILEESLRQQTIQQRKLRRKYLTFLSFLCSLIAAISHHLYFNEHLGTSRVVLQLILLALCVTLLLYHLSGEYQKTIVLPRKFLSSTNKGLRQLNVRLVKIKNTFADSTADLTREFGLFLCTMGLKFVHTAFPWTIQNPNSKLEVWLVSAQLHCQPRFGLNDVKLVLMPRSFSTDIREGWELYRNEFWINEGMRRRKNMMAFVPSASTPGDAEKKAVKKERKERRKRKYSVATPQGVLTEENLHALGSLGSVSPDSLSPYQSN